MNPEELQHLRDLQEAVAQTNQTLSGLSRILAQSLDNIDTQLTSHDQLIQGLVDGQQQGQAKIWQEIEKIKLRLDLQDKP